MAKRKSAKYRLRRSRRDPAFRMKETLQQALCLGFFGEPAEILCMVRGELTAKRESRELHIGQKGPSRSRALKKVADQLINVHGIR